MAMGFVLFEARLPPWRRRKAPRLITMCGHAAVINRYRVLGWSPDRRLVVYRKVALNLVLADRLIGRKLHFVERSLIDGNKVLWEALRSLPPQGTGLHQINCGAVRGRVSMLSRRIFVS